LSKIESAIGELMQWAKRVDETSLPASAAGLVDIVATGFADLGIALPPVKDALDGAWIANFFNAISTASTLDPHPGRSARTRSMMSVTREHGTYHAAATAQFAGGRENIAQAWTGHAHAAMRLSFCELVAHLAYGFATQGRVPHCGPAGRALLRGAIDHAGESHYVPPAPPFRFMGDETAIVTLHFGLPMFVDLHDDSVCPEVIQTGWWEPWIDGVLQKSIGRGDIAVNVGANLGYHVLLIANCVQDSGKVFAYEPNPRLLKRLARSVRWAGLAATTTIMPFAASNARGTMKLNFTPEMSGHGGFFESSDAVWRSPVAADALSDTDRRDMQAVMSPVATSVDVKVATLDETLGKMVNEIHFLLIDAEQAEPLILEGGMDLITRSRDLTIVVEWMNGPTISPSPDMRARGIAMIERLAADGFHFWNIDCDRADIFARPAILTSLTVAQVLEIDSKADLFLRRRSAVAPPEISDGD
jgi:FkbM family methyltransferase